MYDGRSDVSVELVENPAREFGEWEDKSGGDIGEFLVGVSVLAIHFASESGSLLEENDLLLSDQNHRPGIRL
eukprot:2617411-Ditylum_brightwellii.AAC.1